MGMVSKDAVDPPIHQIDAGTLQRQLTFSVPRQIWLDETTHEYGALPAGPGVAVALEAAAAAAEALLVVTAMVAVVVGRAVVAAGSAVAMTGRLLCA